jgi:hypothetical protein
MMIETTEQKYCLPRLDSENDDERISAILIPDEPYEAEEDEYVELPESSGEMLTRYHHFLLDKLGKNLIMTGREDLGYFSWEERFSWGNSKEYKVLKKRYASYTDKFTFIRLTTFSEEFGLMAQVKRIIDMKVFQIPLADLEVSKGTEKERQWIDDYSNWFVNFGPESM